MDDAASAPPTLASAVAPIGESRTLSDLFRARVALTPDAVAYRQYDSSAGRWVDWSWRRIAAESARWRAALAAEGLEAGARVATLMVNGVDYVCVDQAALALGLAIAPLHVTDNPGNVGFIIGDCAAAVVILDSAEYWGRLAPDLAACAELKRVVVLAKPSEAIGDDPRVVRAADWLAAAEGKGAPERPVPPDALAAIVYTSGTTGRPKGVMLSHGNIVANVMASCRCVAAVPGDLFLSFLPLSHTFERTAGYYLPIAVGATVAYARSVAHLVEDMRNVRPTILISVPRIYERAYLAIDERLAKGGAVAHKLSALAERIGWRRFEQAQGTSSGPSPLERLIWPALDWLVARKVRAAFGGRLRLAVAGGAPLPFTVAHFFLAMGVEVLQGYGMTESSPVVSVNCLGRNDPRSVGETLPGVSVKLGDNDELLVKGPSVMQGYWRRPEESAKALAPDGWLHTGDQARLVDGRVFIKGRIKDIIVTSTGEKVSPVDIEQAIETDPLFEQVMIIGEQRPFIAALAVVNRDALVEAAHKIGLSGAPEALVAAPPTRELALNHIRRAVAHFPDYATPRKVWLTVEPWTVAGALMTPTLKLKRLNIETAFAEQIAAMYARG
jgi:long-chain acyl-CoA synthetase